MKKGNSDLRRFSLTHTPGCLWERCRTEHLEISLTTAFNCSSLRLFASLPTSANTLDRSRYSELGTSDNQQKRPSWMVPTLYGKSNSIKPLDIPKVLHMLQVTGATEFPTQCAKHIRSVRLVYWHPAFKATQ